MSKKRYLIDRTNLTDKIYKSLKNGEELFRVFKIYHPVYEIEVNIETETVDDTYHIIEKYMDKLICGYAEGSQRTVDIVFIKDENELFDLLGINGEAYEIANRFFNDLLEAGHFEKTEKGVSPKAPAVLSLKLDKRVSEKTQTEKKLFDVFSMELMPAEFYEFVELSIDLSAFDATESIEDAAILSEDALGYRNSTDIQHMVNNTDYVNVDRIERGLPQGYKKMSLSCKPDKKTVFFPYYLAVFKTGEGCIYRAYRVDNGVEMPWLEKKFLSSSYKSARERIQSLCSVKGRSTFSNPICWNFPFCNHGVPDAENGVFRDEKTDNYVWKLTDGQIRDVLGLGQDKMFKRSPCNNLAKCDVTCINRYDAGKLVFIIKTEKQKKLLLDCMSKKPKEIEDLYCEYAGIEKIETKYWQANEEN